MFWNTAEGMDEVLGQATYSGPSLPLGGNSGLSHKEMWAGCIVSLTTPTSSLLKVSRSVSFRSLAEKASRVFLASYFLRYKRLSMNDWIRCRKGLNRAAIARVETTTASWGWRSWPVRVRKMACVVATPPR